LSQLNQEIILGMPEITDAHVYGVPNLVTGMVLAVDIVPRRGEKFDDLRFVTSWPRMTLSGVARRSVPSASLGELPAAQTEAVSFRKFINHSQSINSPFADAV